MLWPLAACLVLTGIHVYLGVHVIARKVIFVDLALAQIAALGTVVGILLGYEVGKDTTALYLYSLAFTIFGAFVFSVTRMKGEKVPHEAVIGIVYAVAFATTILVLSKSALGPQELDHIIKGELLWVQGPVVIKTAIIYLLVGVFHFSFRKKFMAISFDPDAAERSGINVRLWDFLFYMSFGFVITSSVAIAGVFLVFSYLVIPSLGAMLLSDKLSTRLAIGWIAGSIISFAGVKLSWTTGLPTSPLIVVILAGALLLSAAYRFFKLAESKGVALRRFAAAIAVVALFIVGVYELRKPTEDPLEHEMRLLSSSLSTDRQTAIANLEPYAVEKDRWLPRVRERLKDEDAEVRKAALHLLMRIKDQESMPAIFAALKDRSDEVQRSAIEAVRVLGDGQAAQKLIDAASSQDDVELKIEMLDTALELHDSDAIPLLVRIIQEGGVFASDAYDHLKSHIPISFKSTEVSIVTRWYEQNRSHLRWDEGTHAFRVAD